MFHEEGKQTRCTQLSSSLPISLDAAGGGNELPVYIHHVWVVLHHLRHPSQASSYSIIHSFIHYTRDFPEGQVRTVLISSLYEVLFWQLAYQQ